ncbi:MAG: Hint domain-containing protein, partial [Pseudomonadota bacterium]
TRTGAVMKVRWIGSSSYVPNNADRATPLVRITADAFGPGRPAACVTVGPAARILHAPEQADDEARVQGTLVPARAFVDGVSVFELFRRMQNTGCGTHRDASGRPTRAKGVRSYPNKWGRAVGIVGHVGA